MFRNSSYFSNETTTWNQFLGLSGSLSEKLPRVNSWFVTLNKYWHDKTIEHFQLNFLSKSKWKVFLKHCWQEIKGDCLLCLVPSFFNSVLDHTMEHLEIYFHILPHTCDRYSQDYNISTNTSSQAYGELTNGDLAMIFALGGLFQGIGFLIGR